MNNRLEFDVGDKVVFVDVPDSKINDEIEDAMKHPYLTITSVDPNRRHGRYGTKEAGMYWSGVYWKLYDPSYFNNDLFEL